MLPLSYRGVCVCVCIYQIAHNRAIRPCHPSHSMPLALILPSKGGSMILVTKTSECVCVCFLPIHSGHQVRWTYQPGSHRRKVTQDFSSTFFLWCMPLFFSREGFSHSFPSSTVKSNFKTFCVLTINRSPPVGHFFFIKKKSFSVRKIPLAGIELTSQRVIGYMVPLSYRGDRLYPVYLYSEKYCLRKI